MVPDVVNVIVVGLVVCDVVTVVLVVAVDVGETVTDEVIVVVVVRVVEAVVVGVDVPVVDVVTLVVEVVVCEDVALVVPVVVVVAVVVDDVVTLVVIVLVGVVREHLPPGLTNNDLSAKESTKAFSAAAVSSQPMLSTKPPSGVHPIVFSPPSARYHPSNRPSSASSIEVTNAGHLLGSTLKVLSLPGSPDPGWQSGQSVGVVEYPPHSDAIVPKSEACWAQSAPSSK